ncbi:bifunctional Phosphatidylinositol 3--4-kinase [Babesia duncani]|uniref:Bifunctional Phosphatidylinositol 3--4-kinase n=1 Tax=Babesia duncani TaxID=323732 RepID=A0AAD9PNW1_9APIC|nr:bifunctional Phosphatidylinositol 3--4-kinase [Babesia duncani]
MPNLDIVVPYLNYRKQLSNKSNSQCRFRSYGELKRHEVISTLVRDTCLVKGDHATVSNSCFKKHINASFYSFVKDVCYQFDDDFEGTVDKVLAYLLHDRLYIRCNKRIKLLSGCILILKFLKSSPRLCFDIKESKWTRVRFNKRSLLTVANCPQNKSRLFLKQTLYKVLVSCLHIKRWIIGFKPRLTNLIRMLSLISRFSTLNDNKDWETVRFKNENETALYNVSLALAQIFTCENYIKRHYWLSILGWRCFDRENVRVMFNSLFLLNALIHSDMYAQQCIAIKDVLDQSFNEIWAAECLNGFFKQKYHLVRTFYYMINEYKLLKNNDPKFGLLIYNKCSGAPMVVYREGSNVKYMQYMLYVANHILYRNKKNNNSGDIWILIQLLHHLFAYNRSKAGMLPCNNALDCVVCISVFTNILSELNQLLSLLRNVTVYTDHISLIKTLVVMEISRIKVYCLTSKAKVGYIDIESWRDNVWKQGKLSHACWIFLKQCLKCCNSINSNNETRYKFGETYKNCPIYLKLLSAIHDAQPQGLHVQFKAMKSIKVSDCMLFDSITTRNEFGVRPTMFRGRLATLGGVYFHNWSYNDCLNALVVSNKLNIVERTQACISLSRDPKLLYFCLPQLAQAILVDPGHRVFNLLLLSIRHSEIREQMPLILSGLVHENMNSPLAVKVEMFMKILWDSLSEHEQIALDTQVTFHSEMMALSLELLKVPVDLRMEHMRSTVETQLKTRGPLNLYNDFDYLNDNVQEKCVVGVDLDGLIMLKSATRVPFMVPFNLKNGNVLRYIYKINDDLRQDSLVVQIKWFMEQVFKRNSLNVYLCTFMALPCSNMIKTLLSGEMSDDPSIMGGIIGFIPGTTSRHAIGKDFQCSLDIFYERKFGPRHSPEHQRALDNFIRSLAGYSLLCFLLQVKDRHNANLLISSEGHIIHIDFGFILGTSPAADVHFEQAPFKLTREMVCLMGGVESPHFKKFVDLLVKAFLAIREHANVLLKLVQLLEHSRIPCFRRNTLPKLIKRLYLGANYKNAKKFMLRKVYIALHSKTTVLYDIVQGMQQGIEH